MPSPIDLGRLRAALYRLTQSAAVSAALLWLVQPALAQFTQFGDKLVGINGFEAKQGWSVALSGDGRTAVIGGPEDNHSIIGQFVADGAAWVFVPDQTAGVWTQQGPRCRSRSGWKMKAA